MLLDRGPSWWQGSWPLPVNQAQEFSEGVTRYSDLRQLESDVAAMADHFHSDLDQLFSQCDERPVFDLLRQR